MVNADGSGDARLASDASSSMNPRWSPDGKKIVYTGPSSDARYSNNYEIYAANTDGTGQVNITNNPSVDLSPDWG